MTAEELQNIVGRREMRSLELKESFGSECIETACAFANADGGFIVIGVDDKGCPSSRQPRDESLRDYENRISTSTEPCIAVDAERVSFSGREVVVLKVMENPLKPVSFKGRCYVRKGSVNHQMTPAEIAECHLRSTGSSMDALLVSGATKDDLDLDAVRRYMNKAVSENRRTFERDEDPWRVLVKLGLVKSKSEITRAAYLLFGRNPQDRFSQAVVHAGSFRDEGAVIVDSHDCRGCIQDQIEEALAFVRKNIKCAIVVTEKASHDRYWEFPLEALREALANAVCHRDYGAANNIQVKVFENRVVIVNPGQLPFDMSVEQLNDPDHPSRPRNKLIAQALYDMHVIEQYGSGIRRIKADCDRNGSPHPRMTSERGEFCIKFFGRTKESASRLGFDSSKLGVANPSQLTQAREGNEGNREGNEGDREGNLVSALSVSVLEQIGLNPKVTIAALTKRFNVSHATVERVLKRLQESGRVVRVGGTRGSWKVRA